MCPDLSSCEWIDVPIAGVDAGSVVQQANAAFVQASGRPLPSLIGLPLADALALPPSERARLAPAFERAGADFTLELAALDAAGRPWPLRLSARAVEGGWVLTLHSRAEVVALREKLELACELGRLGTWERDVASGIGTWDASMWRLWDLPPRPNSLSPEEYLRAVEPQDREPLASRTRESLRQPGRHDLRYRLRRRDGSTLHVHSCWVVCPDGQGRAVRIIGIVRDDTEVYRLAARVGEAQTHLQLAADLAQLAVWRRERHSGAVHLDARGWSIVGQPWRDAPLDEPGWLALVHPEDLAELRHQAAQAIAAADANPRDLTVRLRDPAGNWRYVLIRSVIERGADGQVVGTTGVALDVTARAQAAERTLELARRLEMATAAAGLGTWDWLPGSEWHWDTQLRALHGLPPDAPVPDRRRYVESFVHPEDRARVIEAAASVKQLAAGTVDIEMRLVCRNGVQRQVSARTAVEIVDGQRRMFGVVLDITERQAAEQRLREASERAALVTLGAGIGTWETPPDGCMAWWDAQMFRLRGREPREQPVTVAEMLEWTHPDDRPLLEPGGGEIGVDDVPMAHEFRVVWPDGSVRWLASRSTPMLDARARVVRRIGINWDITEVRAVAAAQQEKLIAQRESKAKSQFLARMSHELRTPLNAVLGFSQLLLADGAAADPSRWRQHVDHVRAAGQHLLSLINDVLDLSALESGDLPAQRQPVPIASLVQQSLPLLQPQADAAGVRLCQGELEGTAIADPVALRQALLNLLSNAIKYNRRGGEVRVEAAPRDGRLCLAVSDSGRGMSAHQLAHLFEPFNRLGREREGIEGTGIGLAIVKASIQRMGGSVTVCSREGEGSRFELELPLAAAPCGQPTAAGSPRARGAIDARPAGPRGRVLYIEDDPVNLLLVREMMRHRPDLQLDAATNGEEGLQLAQAHRPALILLDMHLPDIDGQEVLRRLRADSRTAALRCVAVSANAMPEDIGLARAAGFDDYWTKPLDLTAFAIALAGQFGPAPAAAGGTA